MIKINKENILGLILAGGLSMRMGKQDKFFNKLNKKTILEIIIDKAHKQINNLILNANGDVTRFSKYKIVVVKDIISGYGGPLVGILTGMIWAKKNFKNYKWLATFPSDAPFFPKNLICQFLKIAEKKNIDIVLASSNGRTHPVFGLWSINLLDSLHNYLTNTKNRKIDIWVKKHKNEIVNFSSNKIDPFFNINTPEDLIKADSIASKFKI